MSNSISYIEINNSINEILTSPEKVEHINFNQIIHITSCLPKPNTAKKYQELVDSGIGFSLCDIAFILGDYFNRDNHTSAEETDNGTIRTLLNSYLTNLWEIWEKYFLKYGWDHYAYHLVQNEQFNKRLSILNYHYNKLFNKCNDCQKTSINIPAENRTDPMLHLKNLGDACCLSRAKIIGCEGFVYASENLKNEEVFERVYSHWRAPEISRMQLLWIPFISCAGELKRKDILIDIFQLMKMHYREIDFTNVIVFLQSANKAGADEIVKYFDELNSPSQWDLLTPYNPVLDHLISAYAIKDDSEASGKLEFRSFEGEFWAKCFKNYFDKKLQKNTNLYSERKNLLQFQKKNSNDWYKSLCFAQETYVRELRSQIYAEFKKQFSYYDYLDKEKFFEEIASGNVSVRIKKYQEKINILVVGQSTDILNDEVYDSRFLPFIDCLINTHTNFLTNRESFYQWQNDHEVKVSFFQKAEKLFRNISSEWISDEQWQYFIRLLTNRIQNNVAVNLSKIFLAEFHSLKRIFVENFEKVIQSEDVRLSDKYLLLTDARAYIKNISLKLPKYRIMEPRCVDILPEIEQFVFIDSIDNTSNVCSFGSSVNIAGYDGISEDYLRPMFIEIRSNAKKALSKIKKSSQKRYDVNLEYGEDDYSNYLILSVSNNFLINDDSTADPVSTGIGLKNVQYYATFFQRDELQGWAQFKTLYKRKYGSFTVQIYFPLWKN